MKCIFLILFFASQLVSNGYAQQLELKGVKIGMSRDEVKALHPKLACDKPTHCLYVGTHTMLSQDVGTLKTIAEVPIDSFYVSIEDNVVVYVSIGVDLLSRTNVLIALTEKYGKPTVSTSDEYRSMGGQMYRRQTDKWESGADWLKLETRFTKPVVTEVVLGNVEVQRKNAERLKDKAKANAKDL
jgi:hypothetical protein